MNYTRTKMRLYIACFSSNALLPLLSGASRAMAPSLQQWRVFNSNTHECALHRICRECLGTCTKVHIVVRIFHISPHSGICTMRSCLGWDYWRRQYRWTTLSSGICPSNQQHHVGYYLLRGDTSQLFFKVRYFQLFISFLWFVRSYLFFLQCCACLSTAWNPPKDCATFKLSSFLK